MGPAVRAAFVRILKDKAWSELDKQGRAGMPVSRYNRLETAIFTAMAAGKYEWLDDVHNGIDGTPAGFRLELLARLRVGTGDEHLHESVTTELIEKYGFERLTKLVQQADGPTLPNQPSPEATEATGETGEQKSMTNNSSRPSRKDAPELMHEPL